MNYKLMFFNFFRKKRLFKFSSISFCIMIIGYIFLSTLTIGVKNLYENKQTEYAENLFLNISSNKNYNDIKNDIEDINTIVEIYPVAEIIINEYSFTYHDANLVSILEGNKINKSNELLISNYNNKYGIGDVLKIEGETFTIVGIYDFSEYQFANGENVSSDSFYCSYDFYMKNIKLDDVHNAIVKIDSYEHLEYTIKYLSEYSIGSYSKDIDVLGRFLSLYKNIKLMAKVFTLFVMLFTMIVMYIIIHDNSVDFAIFKSFGYSNGLLTKISFIQTITLLLISFAISCVFIFPICFVCKILSISILNFRINSFINCLLLCSISILINLIGYFIVIKRINIIKVLKNDR